VESTGVRFLPGKTISWEDVCGKIGDPSIFLHVRDAVCVPGALVAGCSIWIKTDRFHRSWSITKKIVERIADIPGGFRVYYGGGYWFDITFDITEDAVLNAWVVRDENLLARLIDKNDPREFTSPVAS
jgi:hypothetical protein